MSWTKDFLKGVRTLHPAPIPIGLVLVVAILLSCDLQLRSLRIEKESPWLVSATDYTTHLALEVRKLRQYPQPRPIYFFGGSSLREALVSETHFSEALQRKTSRKYPIHFFGSNNQSFAETEILLDQLPEHGTLVLAVNPWHFSYEPKSLLTELQNYWFLLPSPQMAALMRSESGLSPWEFSLLPGLSHYLRSYWPAQLMLLKKGHLPNVALKRHFFDSVPRLSEREKLDFLDLVQKLRVPQYFKYQNIQAANLRRVISAAKQKHFGIILMDSPVSKTAARKFQDLYTNYEGLVSGLCEQEGIPYWNWERTYQFQEPEFYDLYHLLPQGREKFESAVVDKLANYLRDANAAVL